MQLSERIAELEQRLAVLEAFVLATMNNLAELGLGYSQVQKLESLYEESHIVPCSPIVPSGT